MTRRRWMTQQRCLIAALASACLVAWATPATAQAGAYTVWSCRGPEGTPVSAAAWQPVGNTAVLEDTCPGGGSLHTQLRSSDTAPGAQRGFRFALPPGSSISRYRVWIAAATGDDPQPNAYQAGLEDNAVPFDFVDGGCQTVKCTFGTPDTPLAPENELKADDFDRTRLGVMTVCAKLLGCSGSSVETTYADVRLFRAQVDVRDDDLPDLLDAKGMPTEGQTLTANGLITLDASDDGGGVRTVSLLVDGNEVAHQDAGGACREPYTLPAPCPAQLSVALPLAVATFSEGEHTAQLRAVDAAGNVRTGPKVTFIARPVIVERIVQQTLAPKPVTITVARDRISLPAKGRTISGIVQDAAKRPVPNVTVLVRSRAFGVRRSKTKLERTVTTDAAGRFESPVGRTSRLIVLDVNAPDYRADEPVEVSLMQRMTVGVLTRDATLRNGSTLLLRTSISGVGSGAAGKVVLVQALVEGRWTTVDSLTANSDGRALWRYRFRATTRRIAYRFRVKVERTGDVWPWPTTTSRVLRVQVRP